MPTCRRWGRNCYEEFTAIENVLMPWRIKNSAVTPEARERARELMDLVGLSAVMNNPANKMSGGQQQRTAIARSLINNPSIILADEPTGNLDSGSTEVIYNLLRDINEKFGTTFVIITHDRRIALEDRSHRGNQGWKNRHRPYEIPPVTAGDIPPW